MAFDGRALPTPVVMNALPTISAERYDFILKPTTAGTLQVVIEFLDWVSGAVRGKATTRIGVTESLALFCQHSAGSER